MPLFRVTECFIGPGWRANKTKTKVIEKTPDEKRQTVTDCWSGESKNCKNKKLALEMNPPPGEKVCSEWGAGFAFSADNSLNRNHPPPKKELVWQKWNNSKHSLLTGMSS